MVRGLDVFRLYRIVPSEPIIHLPAGVRQDMQSFINSIPVDLNLKQLGYRDGTLENAVIGLTALYDL